MAMVRPRHGWDRMKSPIAAVSGARQGAVTANSGTDHLESKADPSLDNGEVRIEFHPNSRRSPIVLSPDKFKRWSSGDGDPAPPCVEEPWLPFRSREDFEFAQLVHNAALNKKQVDCLVKLIKRCERNPGTFTFEGVQDVDNSWEDASKLLTPVRVLLATSVCF